MSVVSRMKTDHSLEILFVKHLESSRLITRGSSGLLAVSGGIDSVVFFHLFVGMADAFGLRLGVAHINHRVRGSESDGDEEFVRNLARQNGLPFFTSVLPPQPHDSNTSWEAYAREIRYSFFEEVRQTSRFDWVATGHHSDDQAETVLMRLIEGSGIRGLAGIWEKRLHVIRPLMPFTRLQIQEYARNRALMYRIDASNDNTDLKRNFIRHELIPRVQQLNPDFSRSILRLSRNMKELEEFMEVVVREKTGKIVSSDENGLSVIDAGLLAREPTVIQKRLVYSLTTGDAWQSPWRHPVWASLESFLQRSSTGDIHELPDGWRLLRDRDRFVLKPGQETKTDELTKEIQFWPDGHVWIPVGSHFFSIDVLPGPVKFASQPCIEFADFHKLRGRRMGLRLWRPGDRMKPLGMSRYKKVSDILVDQKVSRFEKDRQFVLTCKGEIVWLCGVRLDDRYRVRGGPGEVAKLTWKKQ